VLTLTLERDTTPPAKPTLTGTLPIKTYQDQVEVEVNGEVNGTIVINGVDKRVIGLGGKEKVLLDTSGDEGNRTFEIFLRDELKNESERITIMIYKELIENSMQDSDNDYIPDAIEILIGRSPTNSDENENGTLDGLETEGMFGDTFFDQQWHLRNLSQVSHDMDLLDIYHRYMGYNQGNPIIVQVVDDGVDADHEDLVANMDFSRSYYHSSSGDVVGDPSSQSDNTHGTQVTGIIGARAFNGKGVRGIAPFVKIAGSNYLDRASATTLETVWLTGEGANEIGVSNNSWGHYLYNAPDTSSLYETIMKLGSETLRDGKGRIYVVSAGNDREEGGNANLDYLTNNRFVVTVAGVGVNNKFAYYSNPGGNILVSGYTGGIGTTTNEGMGGSQTWEADEYKNYTNRMNGTSAAAPMVSGSVALVLEACPNLGWRDIKYLLAKHAKKVDSSYESWVENSSGLWYSSDYGYGLVNPKGIIDDCNGSYTNLTEQKVFEASGDIDFNLDDGKSVTLGGLDINESMNIEWVELTVDANHTRASDYKIELISPAGTKMNVIDPTSISGAWMENGYRFGCAGFIDENSLGVWRVKISDFDTTGEKLSGSINSLTLKVYGH
jgi:subtilisin-like proprotein convertase family protein